MDDIGGVRLHDHLLVVFAGGAFGGGDEARAQVGEVGAEQLRGKNFVAVVEAAGEQQGLVEELPNLGDEGERAPGPCMAASAGGHRDQPVDAGFGGLLGVAAGGHVMEHQPAIAVHGVDHVLHRAEAGDHDGHLFLDADRQIRLQARVGWVDDQVDGEGRRLLQLRKARFDLLQPGAKAVAVTLVERGEAADDSIAAAGEHQRRVGNQEHRRGHQRQAQALIDRGGQ